MISSAGTDAIIALENDAPDFLTDRFPGTTLLAWPLIRMSVAMSIAEVELQTFAVPQLTRRGATLLRRVRTALPSPYSAAKAPRADHVFVVSGTTTSDSPDGRHNWLVDDFAQAVGENGLVLQGSARDLFTRRSESPSRRSTRSLEPLDLAARNRAARSRATDEQVRFAQEFVSRVYGRLDQGVAPERIGKVATQLVTLFRRAVEAQDAYVAMFDRIEPRAVYIQTGAYGHRSHLIAHLRGQGVHVAEPQHGWIGPAHAAYNHGAAMAAGDLGATLPADLLTFGEYWSDNVRYPGRRVAIGKPHLEAMRPEANHVRSRPQTVVIVSSVREPEKAAQFTLAVRDALPRDWDVLYRPHPSERATLHARYPTLVGQDRIAFDVAADVYETLREVSIVIGVASTVLYEALALGCTVLVQDSPLADLYASKEIFGERITEVSDLRVRLTTAMEHTSAAPHAELAESIFAPGAVQNFHRYVTSIDS